MRISSKGRYGLAVLLEMAENSNESVSVAAVAEKLGLSKTYLEQIFSSLKRNNFLISQKGQQGGYRLAKKPEEINVYEILKILDSGLFEKTGTDFLESRPDLKVVLEEHVFNRLDEQVKNMLETITLKDLKEKIAMPYLMYYI